MPIVGLFTTVILPNPTSIPPSTERVPARPYNGSNASVPIVDSLCRSSLWNPHGTQRDHTRTANMNRLARAEGRRAGLTIILHLSHPHQIRRFAIVGVNADWPLIAHLPAIDERRSDPLRSLFKYRSATHPDLRIFDSTSFNCNLSRRLTRSNKRLPSPATIG